MPVFSNYLPCTNICTTLLENDWCFIKEAELLEDLESSFQFLEFSDSFAAPKAARAEENETKREENAGERKEKKNARRKRKRVNIPPSKRQDQLEDKEKKNDTFIKSSTNRNLFSLQGKGNNYIYISTIISPSNLLNSYGINGHASFCRTI